MAISRSFGVRAELRRRARLAREARGRRCAARAPAAPGRGTLVWWIPGSGGGCRARRPRAQARDLRGALPLVGAPARRGGGHHDAVPVEGQGVRRGRAVDGRLHHARPRHHARALHAAGLLDGVHGLRHGAGGVGAGRALRRRAAARGGGDAGLRRGLDLPRRAAAEDARRRERRARRAARGAARARGRRRPRPGRRVLRRARAAVPRAARPRRAGRRRRAGRLGARPAAAGRRRAAQRRARRAGVAHGRRRAGPARDARRGGDDAARRRRGAGRRRTAQRGAGPHARSEAQPRPRLRERRRRRRGRAPREDADPLRGARRRGGAARDPRARRAGPRVAVLRAGLHERLGQCSINFSRRASPRLNHDLHAIDATPARQRGVVVYYRSFQPTLPCSRREMT